MVVSLQSPHHVLATEDGVQQMFGFLTSEIVGQSVMKLIGRKSDPVMFQSVIQNTGILESSKVHFTLHDRAGAEKKTMVATAPFYKEGILIGCHITFRTSFAITLQEAFEESHCPHALVSSKSPNVISMVNEEFSRKFGCNRNQALGQILGTIQGPDTSGWISLIRNACDGQISRNRVNTRNSSARMHPDGSSFEDVVCVPVVEAPNGKVRHILVMFPPPPQQAAGPPLPAVHNFSPARPFIAPLMAADERDPGPGPATPMPASHGPADSASFFSCPHRRGFGPAIFPRRKVALDGSVVPALPVVVTMELLSTLHDLPLHKAAEAIGVSATAFKKACRKLGVRRWTYKRRAGLCGPGPGAECRDLGDSGASDDGGPSNASPPPPVPPHHRQYLPPPMPPPPLPPVPNRTQSHCPAGPDGTPGPVPSELEWAHFAAAAAGAKFPLKLLRPPADGSARRGVRLDWERDAGGPSGVLVPTTGRWAAAPGSGGLGGVGSGAGGSPGSGGAGFPGGSGGGGVGGEGGCGGEGGGGGGGGGGGEDCPGSPVGPAPLFMEPPPAVGDDSLVLDMLALQWPMHSGT
jgi:hypothetical protein